MPSERLSEVEKQRVQRATEVVVARDALRHRPSRVTGPVELVVNLLLVVCLHPAERIRDLGHVSVHRKQWVVAREAEHARSQLRPEAVEVREHLGGLRVVLAVDAAIRAVERLLCVGEQRQMDRLNSLLLLSAAGATDVFPAHKCPQPVVSLVLDALHVAESGQQLIRPGRECGPEHRRPAVLDVVILVMYESSTLQMARIILPSPTFLPQAV